jgi:hypothetical protein
MMNKKRTFSQLYGQDARVPYAAILAGLSSNSSSASAETSPMIQKIPEESTPKSLRIVIQEARPAAEMNMTEKGERGLSEAHSQFVQIIEEEKRRRRTFEANLVTVKDAVKKWLEHESKEPELVRVSDDDSDVEVVVAASPAVVDRKRRCEPQDTEFCAIQKSRRVQRKHVVIGASWSSD